jgi:hypothetical protein
MIQLAIRDIGSKHAITVTRFATLRKRMACQVLQPSRPVCVLEVRLDVVVVHNEIGLVVEQEFLRFPEDSRIWRTFEVLILLLRRKALKLSSFEIVSRSVKMLIRATVMGFPLRKAFVACDSERSMNCQ